MNKDDYVLTALPYLVMGFSVVNVEYRLGKVSLTPDRRRRLCMRFAMDR